MEKLISLRPPSGSAHHQRKQMRLSSAGNCVDFTGLFLHCWVLWHSSADVLHCWSAVSEHETADLIEGTPLHWEAYKRLDTHGEVRSDYSSYKWFGRLMIFKNLRSYWSFWQFGAGSWRVVIRELLSSNGFGNLWSLLWSFGWGIWKRCSYDVWILQNRTGLLLWTFQCLNQTCWWREDTTWFYTNVGHLFISMMIWIISWGTQTIPKIKIDPMFMLTKRLRVIKGQSLNRVSYKKLWDWIN